MGGGTLKNKQDFYQKDFLDNVVKAILWTVGIGVLFLLFLTLLQCSLSKPTSPTWETDLILPLINKTYDMVTIIEDADEPSLYVDSSGQLRFLKEIDLDTTKIEKLLTLPCSSYRMKKNVGILKIKSPEPRETEFALTEVYHGDVGLIPPFSFALANQLARINTFYSATLDQGKALVSAENHLGVDLDSLSIDVIDDQSSQLIETVIFPEGLQDGGADTQEVDLKGKTLSDQISCSVRAHTPGGTIFSLSEKYLELSMSFSDSLFVREALAQIPEVQIRETESFEIPTDDIVDMALIKTGSLLLNISNHTNLSSNLLITFPTLSRDGIPLTVNRFLLPGHNDQVEIPLGEYVFQPESGRELRVDLSAVIESTGSQQVWVSSSDSIVVEADLAQLCFSEVTGIIQPTSVEIDSIEMEIDLPQGFDAVHLPQASLSLEITNGVSLPGDLHILISGDGEQTLSLSGNIEAGSVSHPVKTVIAENDLTQFLNPIPSQITAAGDVSFGNGITSTTITEEDFLIGSIIISSPLELILDSTQVEIDQTGDSLGEDERDLINQRLRYTKVVSKFENHLPVSAKVELYLKTSSEVYTQPDLLIGPIELDCGEMDENGNLIRPTFSEIIIQLDKEKLKIFESVPFYLGGKIFLPGSDGKKVKFNSSDYIKVCSYLEVKVKAGE